MIHPSELLRTDSCPERPFSAPANILRQYSRIDCGITNLPILNRCCNLEKFATCKIFVAFLSLVGFLQGVSLYYFRETSKIWGAHYNIAQEHIEWLIYVNEFFVGLLALIVSHWGNKIHRASWIGGLTILHSVTSLLLIIPEIYKKNDVPVNSTDAVAPLCHDKPIEASNGEINYIALVILGVFQAFHSMAHVSFLTHGITYLDDNTASYDSPAYIAIALAAAELGKQAGIYASRIPYLFQVNAVFLSIIWIAIVIKTFISGFLISMFPRSLPTMIMEQVSASIVDLASGHEMAVKKIVVDGFFKTLLRLMKNKILILNIFCTVFLQSALINFDIFEKYFNQSRFFVSVKSDSMTQLITDRIKQPFVAISVIASGMVVAKAQLSTRALIKWNIVVTILVIILFASTAFLKCEHDVVEMKDNVHTRSDCSSNCTCSLSEFHPICIQDKTYFSPCFAECKNVTSNTKIYQNCTCGNLEATEGACNADKCYLFFTISQGNRIILMAILASTLITNLMINLRCIISRDKALALGLEATFVGVIPYLPVKAIYSVVAEQFCEQRHHGVCTMFSETFGLFLSLSTITLMFVSLLISMIILLILKTFKVDTEDGEEYDDAEELQTLNNRTDNLNVTNDTNGTNSAESIATSRNSLWEMENVGDDHDSVVSIPINTSSEQPRNRFTQSDL